MTRRRFATPLVVAVAALIGACTAVSTSPTTVAAIEFDSLPFPSIVTGDTMRDSLGRASALHAVLFNGTGGIIANPSVQYIAFDTGLTIGAGGILTAQARNGSVRVIASAGGLQTQPRTVLIARRPDSVLVTGKLVDTIKYVVPDLATTNVSPLLSLKLVTSDTGGGVSTTQGWLVSYQMSYKGKVLSKTDTTVASIWHKSANNVSIVDTSGADGTVGRRIRLRPYGLGTDTAGTLTIVATVRYKGVAVRGSPVTFVEYFTPKPAK